MKSSEGAVVKVVQESTQAEMKSDQYEGCTTEWGVGEASGEIGR
jgi:hypothetical protein